MAGLINGVGVKVAADPESAAAQLRVTDGYQRTKFAIFNLVLEQLEALGITAETASPAMVRDGIEQAITRFAAKEGLALNAAERALLAAEVQNEVVGLGPLEPLLKDPSIDDVIVNGPYRIYVERGGQLSAVPVRFRDNAHLMNIIQRIVSPIGRRVDEATPYVDARLPDGSRVNIVIPPIALDGPMVSIRKFRVQAMGAQDYVRLGSMSQEMMGFLAAAVRSRLNILICGGTGSGKTTLLNMLSGYIDEKERLITIEDAAELQLRQSHVVRLETRPPNLDGSREITARDLVRNALRMRPDRIILGEVRGAEAVEMLQAMSTGHDGSMATMHANSSRDAFGRLEMLLGFGGLNGDPKTLRRYVANSIQIIVQVNRMANGKRRVTSVSELTGLEGESYSLNQLFTFEEQPPLSGLGEFRVHSARPFYAHRLVGVPDLRAAVGASP
ncbi:CpaF family protein [Inquilinus limosus]|uniref:CpaF family protein n=1 Tax=Inquilinus limosus TaxID=171674 RepID=UPI000415EDDB|nr:CpaF family protein [Inquilinus limosus]